MHIQKLDYQTISGHLTIKRILLAPRITVCDPYYASDDQNNHIAMVFAKEGNIKKRPNLDRETIAELQRLWHPNRG